MRLGSSQRFMAVTPELYCRKRIQKLQQRIVSRICFVAGVTVLHHGAPETGSWVIWLPLPPVKNPSMGIGHQSFVWFGAEILNAFLFGVIVRLFSILMLALSSQLAPKVRIRLLVFL